MVAKIINAAPMTILWGTQDQSTRKVYAEPEAIPQHLPLVYFYAQKGKTSRQLVGGDARTLIYGQDSFDPRKKWHNHASEMANTIVAEGCQIMAQRIIPDDAGPEANIQLYLDVLSTQVPQYERNSDGSIKTDIDGNPTTTGTPVAGYKVKWGYTYINSTADMATNFGKATVRAGSMTDSQTSTQSQIYPILEFKASSVGEVFHNSGLRIWAPTDSAVSAMNKTAMFKTRAYPFYLSVVRRPDAVTSARTVDNVWGESATSFVLKPGAVDPATEKQLYLADTFISSYNQLDDPKYPAVYGDFDSLAIYEDNIALLSAMFMDAEKAAVPLTADFSATSVTADDKYLFNFISGVSSENIPYKSYVFETNSLRLSEYTNIFANGSADGTMNDTLFATLVSKEIEAYADENSPLQDIAYNVESIFYDSGFPLETKKKLTQFVAVRKDTFVVLGTHVAGAPELTASEDHSVAVSLRTFLQFYPESVYFGTPVMRGMVMGRSGMRRNSQYKKRVPYTFEVAKKAARYMGASDGRWKSGYNFDGAPGSIIESMYNTNVTFTSTTVRNKDWEVGLNWVQRYDRSSLFFPALHTAYSDDTSVLNSFETAMAICQAEKVLSAAWREFSGVSSLTDSQLVERVNKFISNRLAGRFDNRFVFSPETFLTDGDQTRGYSWTTPLKIYANPMRTVQTAYVRAFRMSDLENRA